MLRLILEVVLKKRSVQQRFAVLRSKLVAHRFFLFTVSAVQTVVSYCTKAGPWRRAVRLCLVAPTGVRDGLDWCNMLTLLPWSIIGWCHNYIYTTLGFSYVSVRSYLHVLCRSRTDRFPAGYVKLNVSCKVFCPQTINSLTLSLLFWSAPHSDSTRQLEIGEKPYPYCFAVGPLIDDGATRTYYISCGKLLYSCHLIQVNQFLCFNYLLYVILCTVVP